MEPLVEPKSSHLWRSERGHDAGNKTEKDQATEKYGETTVSANQEKNSLRKWCSNVSKASGTSSEMKTRVLI